MTAATSGAPSGVPTRSFDLTDSESANVVIGLMLAAQEADEIAVHYRGTDVLRSEFWRARARRYRKLMIRFY